MKCCIAFCNEFNSSTFSVPINAFDVWQNSLDIKLESIPIISLSDLKEIIKDPANSSERIIKINKLKEKIDTIVQEDCFDLDDRSIRTQLCWFYRISLCYLFFSWVAIT